MRILQIVGGYLSFLGGAHKELFQLVDTFFMEYWKTHNEVADYFLIDYLIEYCMQHYPVVYQSIMNQPTNNEDVYLLANSINQGCLNDMDQTDTFLYKLSYKNEIVIQDKMLFKKLKETLYE